MYVELLADSTQNPIKFQILHAPTGFLLETNLQIGDLIDSNCIDFIINHAGTLGYEVKIYCPKLKANEEYPLPKISDELADLIDSYPYDLAIRTNGMIFEQRAYIMARSIHETIQNLETKTLLIEAEYWLIQYAHEVIQNKCAYLKQILPHSNDISFRSKVLDMLMVWQPDWCEAVKKQTGKQFSLGNNEYQITDYYHDPNDGSRVGVRVLCKVVNCLEKNTKFTTYPVGSDCALGIHQVECALNQRLA